MSYRIAISSGDFNGIGPEVILRTLKNSEAPDVTPIILSEKSVIDFYIDNLGLPFSYNLIRSPEDIEDGKVNLLEAYRHEQVSLQPGTLTEQAGKCAMLAVEEGIELCKQEIAHALVTAPISKEAVNRAGYNIPGHTEFLAEHTNCAEFMMMLVNEGLRVGLASVHIPLSKVPDSLSQKNIFSYIRLMQRSLNNDFKIEKPDIAVLGLNPHAGDGGIIGTEEIDFIAPAIKEARDAGINASGPHAADGFFGNRKHEHCDGILAMYHDQGLVPFKTLSFGAGVNFTAGLPIIRTSPDHGTAFDIAGENKANPSSFIQAYSLAIELAKNRKREAVS